MAVQRGPSINPSSNIPRATTGNKPAGKFKAGAVTATIWANTAKGETGDVQYFSVALDRRYMDKNGAWQSTSSLRVNDLPKAALVLHKAYEHLVLRNNVEPSETASDYAHPGSVINITEEEVLVV